MARKVKENTVVETTLNLTGSAEEITELKEQLAKLGIEVEVVEKAPKVVKSEPKKDFNRKKYEDIAIKLGVLGKHGVYRFARPTVYKAMEQPKLTKKLIEQYEAELEQIATERGLKWFIEKNAVDEIEIEDEVI